MKKTSKDFGMTARYFTAIFTLFLLAVVAADDAVSNNQTANGTGSNSTIAPRVVLPQHVDNEGVMAQFDTVSDSIVAITDLAVTVDTVLIERYGKRVEPDGFLLEWDVDAGRPWYDEKEKSALLSRASSPNWQWDAINTLDGLAGYFRALPGVTCNEWTFTVVGAGGEASINLPDDFRRDFFTFDKGSFENYGTLTVEWVIPWEFISGAASADSAALSAVTISAVSSCGDVQSKIVIVPVERKSAPQNKILLYGTITVIAMLGFIVSTVARQRGRCIR